VELLARGGVILEDLSGLELLALGVAEAEHLVNELLGALVVEHAEGATLEWGETNAEDSADVTVSGGSDDAVLEGEGGLVDEAGDAAEGNVLIGHLGGGAGAAELVDELHSLRVGLLGGTLLGILGVEVEALASLAADHALLDELDHDLRVATAHSHAQVSLGHEDGDVVGDINANLIREGDGADRHAELLQGLVDIIEGDALVDEAGNLDEEGRQTAVHEEASDVLDEQRGLALLGTDLHGRGDHLLYIDYIVVLIILLAMLG
jgi:hypothetical protein